MVTHKFTYYINFLNGILVLADMYFTIDHLNNQSSILEVYELIPIPNLMKQPNKTIYRTRYRKNILLFSPLCQNTYTCKPI